MTARTPGERHATSLALVVFALTVVVLAWRLSTVWVLPGETDLAHWGMRDFRDNVHYPVTAFVAGKNPYESARLGDPTKPLFGPYAPSTLIVHLPFGLVPFGTGAVLWFLLTLALTLILARLALLHAGVPATSAGVLALGALLLWSRPGQWNLLLGQVAMEMAVVTALVLLFSRRRRALAGAMVGVTMLKPTFGLPLALVVLARREVRVLLVGILVALGLNGLPVAILVHDAGGVQPFVASLRDTIGFYRTNPGSDPLKSMHRLDLTALTARWLGHPPGALPTAAIAIGVLGVAALTLHRLERRQGDEEAVEQVGVAVAGLAMLLWTYHMAYDALLLTPSLVAVAAGRRRPWATAPPLRMVLGVLLAVPMVNYLATGLAMETFGMSDGTRLVVTGINGTAVAAAFVVVVSYALRGAGAP